MEDENILKIAQPIDTDESIRRYEFQEYTPITGTNLNAAGEIRIIIESQDEIFHPSESFLLFEGQLRKAVPSNEGSVEYKDDDAVSLVHNAMMYLFQNIRYELSGHEIESLNHPGEATTMKGMLKYSQSFANCQGLNMCWYKDDHTAYARAGTDNLGYKARHDYIIKMPTPKGTFSFSIPLSHIFGFAEDYDKVLYGLRHVLTLVRKGNDNDAIFSAAETPEGIVNLAKISWYMPKVNPNDEERLKFIRLIESRPKIDVGFRVHQCESISVPQSTTFSWRLNVKTSPECPRWVIVGFIHDRKDNQFANNAVFNNMNAQSVWIELNGNPYPQLQHNTNFPAMQISTLYNETKNFNKRYYGDARVDTSLCADEFRNIYPLHVIDISKQAERLKYGVMDMNLQAKFRVPVAENTIAYALIISDRIINFQSDGKKMNVIL